VAARPRHRHSPPRPARPSRCADRRRHRAGAYLPEPLVGQRVEVGTFVAGDFLVVSSRFNDGQQGYWVTGQLRATDAATPTSLAVAIGWAPTARRGCRGIHPQRRPGRRATLTGRLIADEGPSRPGAGPRPPR
jgi:hypothetical protein